MDKGSWGKSRKWITVAGERREKEGKGGKRLKSGKAEKTRVKGEL